MTRTAREHEQSRPKCRCVNLPWPPDPLTVIEANVDVGPGNAVYIRGQGDGLSWDNGQRLNRGFGGRWIWTTKKARGKVQFQLLLNDKTWAKGRNIIVKAGKLLEVVPLF